MMEASNEASLKDLQVRIKDLLVRAQCLQTREGLGKLIKRIQSERDFIRSLQNGKTPKENQLKSTNVSHLEGLLHSAESFGRVVAVLRSVHYDASGTGRPAALVVDVVARDGSAWVKVTARKAKALHRKWEGDGDYGDHDIVEQARQYLNASRQHPFNYQPPSVHVVFCSGVTRSILNELEKLGVTAHGQVFNTAADIPSTPPRLPAITDTAKSASSTTKVKVNLDVTSLVAMVSDLSHGGCSQDFDEPLIQALALQERERPLLAGLDQFLADKDLYICQTALNDFQSILRTIAGPREMQRAKELLERLTVVQDDPSERARAMEGSNRIKNRAKVIFGTGDKLKAITTTANLAFVRAAKDRGVCFAVHAHQSRALTEKKQKSALDGQTDIGVPGPLPVNALPGNQPIQRKAMTEMYPKNPVLVW